ncbi:MAG: site-specific DNA-methyltransferase [Planctomycetaceae bacterium]|jgi:site-specific DNA-methyltransferase (adenine-specific)/site-specific DNA-methyltransferase (cytosine-N4-specific)|nr:site-specific DNA-methyltransferase [Planctomycetaceae bacterium]
MPFPEFTNHHQPEIVKHYCNDSLVDIRCDIKEGDSATVLQQINDNTVDLIVTSPPYADARKNTYGGVSPEKYVDWFLPISEQLLRVIKPTGTFIQNIKEKCVDGERSEYVMDLVKALRRQGWRWTEEFIWHKSNPFPGKYPDRFRDAWEHLFQFNKTKQFNMYQDAVKVPSRDSSIKKSQRIQTLIRAKAGSRYIQNRVMSVTGSGFDCSRNVKIGNTAYPANVLYASVETTSKQHPAVFPESIPEFFVKLFTVECDLVLDPFLGSGTSGVVARRLKRNFIGIEQKPEYIEIARKRIFRT